MAELLPTDKLYINDGRVLEVRLGTELVWEWPVSGPAFGSFMDGGYYMADHVIGGVAYRLIMSPKSAEANLRWESTTGGATGATSTTDGAANTSVLTHSRYQCARHCADATVSGQTDWYLPAISEWEAMYPNFGALPTDEIPGPAASSRLASSTESSASEAMIMTRGSGATFSTLKRDFLISRPIRRVAIP